ncbi:UDP-sugar-dependent glycosyltransferase 52 [Labeo rohita]|uniref:UDP-sugar-dependent glycosyltransferase 52 n=1 Tax=Labeo rohita TaxID=84645 RepID=A0ABQ8MQX2_LABRO|nr:UDP-sugar-dependent glycosyltransferase 52 [Labeo rohita]
MFFVKRNKNALIQKQTPAYSFARHHWNFKRDWVLWLDKKEFPFRNSSCLIKNARGTPPALYHFYLRHDVTQSRLSRGPTACIASGFPCVLSAPGRLSLRREPSPAFLAGLALLPPRRSWGSQLDLLEGMETGEPLSPSSPGRSGARSQGSEARSAVPSTQRTASVLPISSSEEVKSESVGVAPHSPQYEELLEVVTRAVAKLNIDWPAEKQAEPQRSKLDERFLRNRPPPSHRSLPFFPDLHTEVSRSWGKPYSARLFVPASDYYGNVVGTTERGYRAIPRVEQTLASYLSPEASSSLNAPVLPTKPLRTTSVLVGKGHSAAGQAGSCLHTMAVLQAYQADLLKELDESDEVSKNNISELRRAADLSLPATKETARAIGRYGSYGERQGLPTRRSTCAFWPVRRRLNFVVDKYQEACKQAEAFQRFLPRRVLTLAECQPQPQPSASSSHRASQKQSRGLLSRGPTLTCPQEIIMHTLPVFQDAVVSDELFPQSLPPGNVAELGSSSPLRWSLEQLVRSVPAGVLSQGTDLAVQENPEASLERLVSLVDYLAAWKLLPNVSAWVLHTVERGYRIQFGAPPPPFNGVFPTVVGPEQGLVIEQVATLLRKEAIEVVPPQDRESVLQPVLHRSEEGWGPASYFRSETVEPLSHAAEVQNVDNQSSCVTNQHSPPCTFMKCVDAALAPLLRSHLDFAPGMAKAFLYPRPGYIPKVPSAAPRPVVLQAFCPPPFQDSDQQKLNCMCPVRALDAYVHRAALWRKSEQLFVCFGPPKRGLPASKHTISRWIVDAISLAYESSGLPSPLGVKAHSTSTFHISASKAFLSGVPLQDICNAAGWSSPLTFVRFYDLDLRVAPGSSVLSA